MKLKNNVMVFDTETIGGFDRPIIHDIGYIIVDKDFNQLVSRRFLVKETRSLGTLMHNDRFYKTKAHLYNVAIDSGLVKILNFDTILDIMYADCKLYNVNVFSCYNIAFDDKAIKLTSDLFDRDSKFMKYYNKSKKLCIWNLATKTFMDTNEFRDYCERNNYKSEKGNYITNAEIAYKYVYRDSSFIEEHTSLEDVKAEVYILEHICKYIKCNCDYGIKYGCWKAPQKKK